MQHVQPAQRTPATAPPTQPSPASLSMGSTTGPLAGARARPAPLAPGLRGGLAGEGGGLPAAQGSEVRAADARQGWTRLE